MIDISDYFHFIHQGKNWSVPFVPSNSPHPKDIQFTIIWAKEPEDTCF